MKDKSQSPPATGDVNITEIAPQGIQTAEQTGDASIKAIESIPSDDAGTAGLSAT